jgi:arylsulfatase A-like enzyme
MNVIWIVADSIRQDHIGAYGEVKSPLATPGLRVRTPSIDALAAKSVRFDNYYAAGFPTMPTRADHHTGRWSMSFMGWGPLPEGQVTLAQTLVQKGFTTAAAVDNPFYLRSEMNYDRGFQGFFMEPGQLMGGFHWSEPRESVAFNWTRDKDKPTQHWGTEMNRNHESWDARAAWRYESDRPAPRTFTAATQWLERHYKEDFFLYIDTWDPHEPWDAPPYYTELYWPGYDGELIYPVYGRWQEMPGYTEEKVRKANATYCGKITMVDTWIGRLLRTVENMGLMEKTAIIFTTDHGFYFGERGVFGKMSPPRRPDGSAAFDQHDPKGSAWGPNPLYKENILIPLLIYVPGIPPGVYDPLTTAVDIMPTVLDFLGQDIPGFVEGSSLLPKMRDTSLPGREFVVTSEPFTNPGDPVRYVDNVLRRRAGLSMITVTTEEWSLLYSPDSEGSELYNLKSDPRQQQNVISHRPEVAKELHQYLVKFMRDTNVAPHLLKTRLELQLQLAAV